MMRRAFETVAIDRLDRIGEWVLLSALCDGRGIARDGRGHGQLTGDKIVWISLSGANTAHIPKNKKVLGVFSCAELCSFGSYLVSTYHVPRGIDGGP